MLSSIMISTLPLVKAITSSRSLDTLLAMPSVSIPASWASTLAARRYMDTVFSVVPTFCGSCTVEFIAVTRAADSSNVLLAAARPEADLVNASPKPSEEIAKLFSLLLSPRNQMATDRIKYGGQAFRPASHISLLDYSVSSDCIFTLVPAIRSRGTAKPTMLP